MTNTEPVLIRTYWKDAKGKFTGPPPSVAGALQTFREAALMSHATAKTIEPLKERGGLLPAPKHHR